MTKKYLILANIVLVVFAIWFSNVGLLPFKNLGDFAFFAILALILGLYRPGWTFLFFVGALALENINLAPKEIGLALRPYQFFGLITIISLLIQAASKRLAFPMPKFQWFDILPIVFAIAGFLSAVGAINKGVSFKQSIIALSFVALYFLTRIYVQSFEDAKRVLPFFLSSGLVVSIYAIWQNVKFLAGANSFEVMPGRPNGTFTEADWLGIYLVFLLSIILTIIFYQSKKTKIFNLPAGRQGLQFLNYTFLTLVFVTLLLTVSRSAWIGAVVVVIGFLKYVLYDGSWKFSVWQWKKMLTAFGSIAAVFALSVFIVYIFGLTNFQLSNRAASTAGLQKITIACQAGVDNAVPANIKSVEELAKYNCRHINLEEIEKEKSAGNVIMEVSRPDPNVGIRSRIYQQAIIQIKTHPIWGIGWGSISSVLGTDERGAGLNASNIFLEVALGSGILGILFFVILLTYIFVKGAVIFFEQDDEKKIISAFVMLGWTAIVIPNLFNSGIFLGFVWIYLAIAVGLLAEKNTHRKY